MTFELMRSFRRTLFDSMIVVIGLLLFNVLSVSASSNRNSVSNRQLPLTGDIVNNNNGSIPSLESLDDPDSEWNQLFVEISPQCNYDQYDFKLLAEGIQKGLGFYEENIELLVLDAALGTRVAEAQLTMTLKTHPKLPQLLNLYLKYLLERSSTLSENIVRGIRSSPVYSKQTRHTIPWVESSTLWELPETWEPMSVMKSYETSKKKLMADRVEYHKEAITESISDECIYQLFQCETQDITEECRQTFLTEELSLYSLTHQVIYMLIAEKRECVKNATFLANFENQDWKLFKERLCGKVWQEANYISNSKFPATLQDLFTEQIAICGMAGYPNFFRRDWLLRLLYWQSRSSSGCFRDPRQSISAMKMLEKLHQHMENSKNTTFNGLSRQRRSDAYIPTDTGSCSVHFTAVGLSAFAINMRYFVDTCLADY